MLEQKVNDFYDLHKACHFGKLDRVKTCLAEGVDVNAVDPNTGKTPIIVAAHNGHTDIVRYLCSESPVSVDVNLPALGGLTVSTSKAWCLR